jgi:hypothetical protein
VVHILKIETRPIGTNFKRGEEGVKVGRKTTCLYGKSR